MLPASLAALRLESEFPIDLGELVRGEERLSAAAEPVLGVRSAVICCSLVWLTGGMEPRVACDTATALHAERLVSKLPAGFAALEMHAQCITVNCSAAVQVPTPEAAAWELCLFFAHAPLSYRRFSLCWEDAVPLRVHLSWPLGFAEPGSTALARQGRLAFDSMDALAKQLQDCAVTLNMTVAVCDAPKKHVVVSRL